MKLARIKNEEGAQTDTNSTVNNRPLYEIKNDGKRQLSSEGIIIYYCFL